MRGRRREPGSSVIRAATAPPPVSEGAFGDLQIVQSQYLADSERGSADQVESRSAAEAAHGSSRSLLRATGSMAIANLVSRITGFVRVVVVAAAGVLVRGHRPASTLEGLVLVES